ncbi:OLC1v1007822C1 [Oldenlandia corymbosa var. corymbosa]|uniref:7'-O-demethylcephaeline methyltransferase n=1 Tax=Oldenlandia corymbosa var. corymbosa TaxID=529605 RepID=A0AAV1DK70_OLDCO|nr:OLC1v1007822C1 [Oldenlandia corymbosa var. corymbosa]
MEFNLQFINSMSLKCAVQLGIPDIIHQHVNQYHQPMTLHHLVNALPINPAKSQFIHRLMRILTHTGFFQKEKIGEEEGYSLTPSSKLLLKDNPLCQTPFLMLNLDPVSMNPWHHLSQWLQENSNVDGSTAFVTCHGKSPWELSGNEPRLNQLFNEAMICDSRLVSKLVIENCGDVFLGLNSMVDVAGGSGTMAKAMIDAFPGLKIIVLDLPYVVDGLKSCDNLAFIGGNMFEAIPPADAIFLKWILHNWGDKECVQLLEKCKEAIQNKENGGKVIIIDMVVMKDHQQERNNGAKIIDHEAKETQLFFDMEMMVLLAGKERNEEEWAKLFYEAGFNHYKITPLLGFRSLIELYYY